MPELWALALPTITKDDGRAIVARGETVTHRIEVVNPGDPAMATTVMDAMPAALENVTWTCTGSGGAVCTASGTGSISDSVALPGGSRATYLATGTVAATATGTLSNTATITLAADFYRQSATDVDVVAAAMSYFVIDACRLVDTRVAGGLLGTPSLQAREMRVLPAHGHCGIPATARALALNVTVTGPGRRGTCGSSPRARRFRRSPR